MDYIHYRHPESNMTDLTFQKFREKAISHSHMATLKLNGEIVACSWIDMDKEIMVGDYCFYNIDKSRDRRLGSLMDLKLLEYAQEHNIPFITFGALNDESPKLRHKGQYRGTHIFTGQKWQSYQRPANL